MVLAEAAVLLGHREAEEPVLAEELEVAAREHQLVVEPLGVGAQLLLAELDQGGAELLLPIGVDPVRIPVVPQAPEGLRTPTSSPTSAPPVHGPRRGSHPSFEGSGRATRAGPGRATGAARTPPPSTRPRSLRSPRLIDSSRSSAICSSFGIVGTSRSRNVISGLVLNGSPVEVAGAPPRPGRRSPGRAGGR